MVTSPLPSRSRSVASNPFTMAKAASLHRANSSNLSSKSAQSQTQSQSSSSRPSAHTAKPKPQPIEDDIEDSEQDEDEDDDEHDGTPDLGGGLASSPYFTQPTQAVTQPTQLVKKPLTTLRRQDSSNGNGNYNGDSFFSSSSAAPPLDTIPVSIPSSSPLRPAPSFVEVPASSPMGPKSPAPNRPAPLAKMHQGRLAGLMAPVGTSYKSPAARASTDKGNESDDNPLNNIISIQDSSEDELDSELASRRARGDIRPSSFQRGRGLELQKASEKDTESNALNYRSDSGQPSDSSGRGIKMPKEGVVKALARKLRTRLVPMGYNAGEDMIRECLVENSCDFEKTLDIIVNELREEEHERRNQSGTSTPIEINKVQSMIRNGKGSNANSKKDLIRGFAYNANGNGTGTANTSRASTPATPSSQQSLKRSNAMESSPRPKRRRLVQGRRNREPSPPPAKSTSETTKASKTKANPAKKHSAIVVESDSEEEEEAEMTAEESDGEDNKLVLDDNDGDDSDAPEAIVVDDDDDSDVVEIDDEEEDDDDVNLDVEKRVLAYLNTCTVDDLVAMLGAKARSRATTILSHRPFRTRYSVTRIQSEPAPGARGRKKATQIGEDIYDEVEEYVAGLRAIDVVVAQCEQKGLKIRQVLNQWDVDHRGSKKGMLTPESIATPNGSPSSTETGKVYAPLPIPQEPELMRGHCQMKTYQLFGLNWLWELYQRKFGCILADDMGLGKTCQVISFLSHIIESYDAERDEERPWPNLVVVPPSTLANWQAEFARFAPDINVTTYRGSQMERQDIFEEIQESDDCHVVLATYSMVTNKQDLHAMRKMMPNTAIFDEGHKMKNCNTAVYQALKRIDAKWRLVLTGTPVQNNLTEMINLLRFIQPHLFERHVEKLDKLFSQKFTLQEVSNGALLFSDRVRRARSILEPFILQRRKEQVLSGMPKKTSSVAYCEMDDTQRRIYETYEEQFRAGKERRNQPKAKGVDGDQAVIMMGKAQAKAEAEAEAAAKNKKAKKPTIGLTSDQNNLWVQLRKAAIHAQLFRRHYDDKLCRKMANILMKKVPQEELRQDDPEKLVAELQGYSDFELHTWCRDYACLASYDVPDGYFLKSGKVQKLLELIKTYQANGDRALVFSRFARVLNILREVLDYMDIPYVLLEGATRVEERQAIINEYNSNPEITVFLLTTGAGGTGINLTAANKVVIFDQSDNPQDDVQAENRAHRLGQTRDVEIVKLVTRGTIEELVYKACQTKLELAERVTAGSASRDEVEAFEKMEREQGDGAKASKAIEEEVLQMLQEKKAEEDKKKKEKKATPPQSDDDSELSDVEGMSE